MRYGLVRIGAAPQKPSIGDQEIADYIRAYLPDDAAAIGPLRAQAEEEATRLTGRAILNQGFRMDLAGWPLLDPKPASGCLSYSRSISLPRNPVVSVGSIKYYDENDELQTVEEALYVAVTSYEPGIVFLRKDFTWPAVSDRPDAVQIEFTAGHGEETISASSTGTPNVLRQAMLLLCRHFYAGGNPNPVAEKVSDYDTALALLMGQRVNGFVG